MAANPHRLCVCLLFQCFLQVKLAESNTTPEPAPSSLAIVGLTPGKSRYRTCGFGPIPLVR
jgi:hypothetical protein